MIKPTTQEHDNIACARPSLENVQRNSQAVHVYLLRLACLHSLPSFTSLNYFTPLLIFAPHGPWITNLHTLRTSQNMS